MDGIGRFNDLVRLTFSVTGSGGFGSSDAKNDNAVYDRWICHRLCGPRRLPVSAPHFSRGEQPDHFWVFGYVTEHPCQKPFGPLNLTGWSVFVILHDLAAGIEMES
jgi:hypothetical protein